MFIDENLLLTFQKQITPNFQPWSLQVVYVLSSVGQLSCLTASYMLLSVNWLLYYPPGNYENHLYVSGTQDSFCIVTAHYDSTNKVYCAQCFFPLCDSVVLDDCVNAVTMLVSTRTIAYLSASVNTESKAAHAQS